MCVYQTVYSLLEKGSFIQIKSQGIYLNLMFKITTKTPSTCVQATLKQEPHIVSCTL